MIVSPRRCCQSNRHDDGKNDEWRRLEVDPEDGSTGLGCFCLFVALALLGCFVVFAGLD